MELKPQLSYLAKAHWADLDLELGRGICQCATVNIKPIYVKNDHPNILISFKYVINKKIIPSPKIYWKTTEYGQSCN